MELREPPDQQPLPRPPRSSVMEAWQQPRGSRAKAKRDSTRASPTRRVRRKPQVPKADKATQITPSFETLLKQRAASRRKKRSEDKGYGGTRPRRSTAPSPGYPKQSFSRAPRRSKVLNNLYMHLYEEVGEDEAWAVQRVEGLPKAFFIFSTLRNGRINVNDLLLTLHTLGILVTSTEMRKALKVVDIDGNGSVSFTDFLAVLNETSPFAQTEAFQNTYQAFSKMRKGMIAVDDLQPTLVSMGVALSVETLQEALTHIPVDKDGQLNVSDFLMAVSDLEHHYEDVESLDLYDTLKPMKPRREFDFDAKARVRRRTRLSFDVKYLQKADAHPLDSSLAHQEKPQQAGKLSSSQRPRFLSFQEKFPTRFDREDSLEESPKTTKRRSTQRRPPWSAGIEEDLKESLEDVESPFALEQIQKSRQSAAARGPAGTKAPERASARGQYGSDYEALQDAFEIVSKIKADYIEVGELHSTLDTMGIPLADEEFQEALQKVKLEKDGTVNFSHFMIALANTRRFSEFSVLKDAIDAISKIEGDKVAASDLLSCVKNMGIHLSDREFQEALKLVSVDANRKVYIKDFIQGLTKSPRFSELLVAQDTIKAMSRIRGDLVDVQDLERILTNMGVHLSKAEFQEMLTSATVDKDGRVKLEQFMTLVSKMQRFSELGALNKAINAFGQIKEDKVKISELESCLHSMGVHLSKEELEEATRSLSVSKDGTVDIKELMSALTGTRRFSNFVAVQEALRAVQHIKEDDIEVSRLATSLSTLGLRLANEVIGQVLKSARVDEAGRVKFTDFMRALSRSQHFTPSSALQDAFSIISTLEGEKIGVEDLRAVLSNLNVSLSGKEFSEALKFCDVDASGKVNLKDFIRGVTSTRRFAESVELQLTCLAISKLKDDHFDLHDLESILSNMGLQLAKETLKEVMKTASVDDNGKVNFREFITVLTQLPHFPETTVLKDTFDAMSNIKEDNIHVDALDSTLASMGILLTEEELRELLESLTIAEDGMVNFKDVMMYMTGTRRFTEFEALQDAFNALSKISGDKMEVSSLPLALEAIGIHLTPEELQEALTSSPADESGKVNVKEFMKALTNTPRFSEYVALQDAFETINKIKEDKVPVAQLEQTLNSVGVHLTKESLQEGLKTAATDDDGRVNFKDFLTSLGDTQNFSELEILQNATKALGRMQGGKIHPNDLKSTLENLGISLEDEELQKALKAVAVDAHGTVNLKEFLTALASLQHFSDSVVLQDAVSAFSRIREDKVDLQDMDSILASLGISLASEEIQEALQKISPDEGGKVNFKEFLMNLMNTQLFAEPSAVQEALDVISKVEDDKIEVSHLESALANMGITLTKGELEEALKRATVNGDGKVNFKEFMKGLTGTKRFSRTLEMEGAVKAIGMIKEDTVDVGHLESIMREMGIHLTPEEIQKALTHVTHEEDGKVNLKDFMMALTKTRRFSQAEKDRVDVHHLDSILGNMGIYLTNEELQEALKRVTVDADGKVYLSKFLKGVRALRRFSQGEGKKVDISDLDSLLAEMGMHLTHGELQEVLKHVIVDGDGKVNVSDFTKSVISTRRASQAERDRVPTSHLDSMLGKMGIFLTEEELQEALKHTQIDAEGKVNLSEFMKSVQQLSKAEGEKVAVDNLASILANMGIHLTDEEFQKALGGVTRGADGKVDLKHFMASMMGTRRSSQWARDTVDLQNLDSILDTMGVRLTNEELQEVLKHASVDADGKVKLGEFMKGVRTVQKLPPAEEDKVDVRSLGSVLADLGIHLTQEELQEALKHSPADRNGKVDLSAFMKSVVNTRRPSQAERDTVDLQNLDSILDSMGVHLTNEEVQEVLKHVTADADGKVNFGEFMKGVKNIQKLPPGEEDKVDVGSLGSVLADLGIHLTQEELQEALKHSPADPDSRVSLRAFLKSVMDTRRPSQAERDKVDLQNLDSILDSMGVHLTNEELQEVLKHVTLEADGKVNLGEFLKGVRTVQKLPPGEENKVDVGSLGSVLADLGIHLTQEELQEALKHSPADRDGKVSLSAFMKSVMNARRPSQAERDKVDLQNLDSILHSMGVHLTSEELQEALQHATVDANGKVNLGEFMKGVRTVQKLPPREEDKVDVGSLGSVLADLGIHLTQEELQEALKHSPADRDGKVDLRAFMKSVMNTRRPSQAERDKVDLQNLDDILDRMGVHLTNEELQEALKHVTVDADGKVNLGEFMKGVRTIQKLPPGEEDKVDVGSLDSILANLGIHLTQEELQEALKHSPADRDDRVSLSAFMRSVMDRRRPSQAERDRVDLRNLDSILAHMGIYLTNEELQEVLKFAPVDVDGKVNLSKFMQGVRTAQPMTQGPGEKVNVCELDSILASLGIHVTSEELQETLKHTTVNEDGTVNLKDFMRALNATRCLSSAQKKPQTTFGPISDTNMTLKSLPKKMMLKPLPKKTSSREVSGILLDRSKCKAAKNLTRDQLEAFRYAYNFFSKDADGNIDLQGLETTAKQLGISLTEQEAYDELVYADMDGDGKVNFSDFLTIVSDNKRFIQAVAPEKGSMEDFDSVDATGILLFEVLSKLVEMSALPRKAMLEIVSYYRQKFLESTGRRAWMDASSLMDRGKKLHKFRKAPAPPKGRVTCMSAFAGAARISVMNDKELEAYVETLRASSVPSDSPYAQVPIFPLLPNRDGMTVPKPKKDFQKLEMQRRKEPISSFENHFFHKRNWLHEATAFKPPDYFKSQKTSLSLGPHLMERRHRLTIDDLGEIRLNVKKVTEMYKQGMALKERNRMLRLWRRLHGGQIGLESGNHSFYHTFSTYSWSWNARQELVTPNELQEYDNKLYHREHSSACSDTSEVKGGKRKGNEKK